MKTALLIAMFATNLFAQPAPTSTDVFVMLGSDFSSPGLKPRANYNVGVGHTFAALRKIFAGDEVTLSYTYENNGSHGFWQTPYGAHTETVGLMKNFGMPKTQRMTGYTWMQTGVTSFTGGDKVQNRLYGGVSAGLVFHVSRRGAIWLQESLNKVATFPCYTTTGVGYAISF